MRPLTGPRSGNDGAWRGLSRRASGGLAAFASEFAKTWKRDVRFAPKMKAAEREAKYTGWRDSVRKLLA